MAGETEANLHRKRKGLSTSHIAELVPFLHRGEIYIPSFSLRTFSPTPSVLSVETGSFRIAQSALKHVYQRFVSRRR